MVLQNADEQTINGKFLTKMKAKQTLILRIRRQLTFLWHIMRKSGLDNMTLTGSIYGKSNCEKQWMAYLMRTDGGTVMESEKDRHY